MIFLLLFSMFIFLIYECILHGSRMKKGTLLYDKAKKRSNETGKPLLVIGNPESSFKNKLFGTAYGCGDVCLDIVGCGSCKTSIKSDALQYVRGLSDNSYVIFESCVLEMIPEKDLLQTEIERVSGNDTYQVRSGGLTQYIFPLFRRIIPY